MKTSHRNFHQGENTMSTTTTKPEDNLEMRVLKTATCKTLSGKSTLTYQLGVAPDSVVHIRITKNSGGGFFSDEWISHDAVQAAFKGRRDGAEITSYLLAPLFQGKSSNNTSFLLAALKHLKLVRPLKNKQRLHEPCDSRPFLDQVNKLMSSPEKPTRKSPVRKASAKKTTTKTVTKKAVVKKASTKKAAIKRASVKKRSTSRLKKASTN
jgi:hypothetical protein